MTFRLALTVLAIMAAAIGLFKEPPSGWRHACLAALLLGLAELSGLLPRG